MKQRVLPGFAFALFLLLLAGSDALAQTTVRMDETVFIRPRVGLSSYLGDNEKTPFNFDGDLFDGGFPYSLGLEVGYQFNPRYSLGLGFQFGDYRGITEFVNGQDFTNDPNTRSTVQLLARYLLSEGKVAPYLHAGAQVSFGKTLVWNPATPNGPFREENNTSFGPLFGAGLDVMLSQQVSFFVETTANVTFPDDAADGRDDNGFGGFDFLINTVGAGLKFNLKSPFVPAVVGSVTCPAGELETGQGATFAATVNADATQPVSVTWDFGDGATASGLTATHIYEQAGTFTATVAADNGRGASTATCMVTVVPACTAAEIVTMTASTMNPDTHTEVRFNANVQGTAPVTYRWDFGDGATSTEANPSHTFARAGTYTVTLEATNCGGTVSRTMTVTVTPWENPICAVAEMNSVYFDRNSSTLTEEARMQLQENLEILRECPNLTARIEGFAAPGERRTQGLSEDRARAVEQFYVDNGISAGRLTAQGMGRVSGVTSKKEGTSQYRRADTIPVRN